MGSVFRRPRGRPVENSDFTAVAGASVWLSLLPREVCDLVGAACVPWARHASDGGACEWVTVVSSRTLAVRREGGLRAWKHEGEECLGRKRGGAPRPR